MTGTEQHDDATTGVSQRGGDVGPADSTLANRGSQVDDRVGREPVLARRAVLGVELEVDDRELASGAVG